MIIKINKKSDLINLLLLLICLITGNVYANEQPMFQLYDGIIIDKNIENIYAINPENGIDSVNLKNGLLNWHSDSAAYPIMVDQNQLLAQQENSLTGKLTLVSINLVNGEQIQSKQLSLPNSISAPIADGVDKRFNVRSNFDRDSNGEILWSYHYKLAQGMLSEETPTAVDSYGLIKLDNSRSLNTMNLQVLQQPHPNSNKIIEATFLESSQIDENARQFKSINGEHVLVSHLNDNTSQWYKYTWSIYNLNGQLIGTTKNSVSYSPFIVNEKTLVFISQPNSRVINNNWVETPLTMQAVSLESGQLIWDKEVRDLKYKGPYPN